MWHAQRTKVAVLTSVHLLLMPKAPRPGKGSCTALALGRLGHGVSPLTCNSNPIGKPAVILCARADAKHASQHRGLRPGWTQVRPSARRERGLAALPEVGDEAEPSGAAADAASGPMPIPRARQVRPLPPAWCHASQVQMSVIAQWLGLHCAREHAIRHPACMQTHQHLQQLAMP